MSDITKQAHVKRLELIFIAVNFNDYFPNEITNIPTQYARIKIS